MTAQELNERQHWTLNQKIDHSLGTIESFVTRVGGLDKVYLSFSGGKDSTVLLHLARWIFPNILAVFCSTGNEYPEIVQFVNQTKRGEFGDYPAKTHPSASMVSVWLSVG